MGHQRITALVVEAGCVALHGAAKNFRSMPPVRLRPDPVPRFRESPMMDSPKATQRAGTKASDSLAGNGAAGAEHAVVHREVGSSQCSSRPISMNLLRGTGGKFL